MHTTSSGGLTKCLHRTARQASPRRCLTTPHSTGTVRNQPCARILLDVGRTRPCLQPSLIMRFGLHITLLTTLVACSPDGQQTGEQLPAPAVAPDSATPLGSAARPVDPYANYSKLEDPDCDLDPARAHPEPLALVREFVDRDGRGEFAKVGLTASRETSAASALALGSQGQRSRHDLPRRSR
jgi:hypothetical protein